MKTLGPASLYTFLEGLAEGSQGAQLYCWDLFTISLATGAVLRLTSADQDITMPGGAFSYSGHTFSAAGPYINRSMMKQSIGFSVDSCEITLTSPPGIQFGASPFLAAMAHGQFDGATVQVDRLFQRYWGDFSIGAQPAWFKGQVGAIDELDQAHCKFTINSKTELLNIQMPYNLYQPGCFHTLGDTGCTVNLATNTYAGTVAVGSNASVILAAGTPTAFPGPVQAPLIVPTIGYIGALTTGVNLAQGRVYYAQWTAVSVNGESTAGPQSSLAIPSSAYQAVVYPPSFSAYNNSTNYAPGAIVSYGGPFYFASLYGGAGNNPGTPFWVALVGLNLYVGVTPGGAQQQDVGVANNVLTWNLTSTFTPTAGIGGGGAPHPSGPVVWVELGTGLTQANPPPIINSSGYFALGTIVFTSGQNQGVSRNVLNFGAGVPGAVQVVPPLPFAPATGDSFVITPGCEKSPVACTYKFFNIQNFGGCPFIPQPQQVL